MTTQERSALLKQYLQNEKKISRGKRIASTILLIVSGVLLYTENILDIVIVKKFLSLLSIKYDLNKKGVYHDFDTLKNVIYAMNMSISPMIFIAILFFRMKPYKWAFIIPLYGYCNMFIGTIILAKGYQIFDFWWYRLLIFFGVILIWWIFSGSLKYFDAEEKSEDFKRTLLENYRLQLENETA